MHVSHVRTTTPTHSHSTHEPYLQLCTFYFWPYRILTLPYTHSLFITMFFILAFILILLILRPRGTHLVPRHWWLPTWGLHGLAFSSTPLAPTEIEDATRLSPSTLVTPDVGPPWPLRSRRLRSPRRSSRTQPHALLDHYLARATRSATTSTSLGHEQLARPCHLFSRPRACNSLSHRYEIARPQQLARHRAQSDNPPDPPLSTSSNSLSLRFRLQLQTHSDTATIPQLRSWASCNFELHIRSLIACHLRICIDHLKPAHLANMPWTSLPPVLPPSDCRYRPFEHSFSRVRQVCHSLRVLWQFVLVSHSSISSSLRSILEFSLVCFHFACFAHSPYFHFRSFNWFSFSFWRGGYCSDSHARFTCTHYNTHALAQYTRTVFTTLYFLLLTLPYLDLTVYPLTFYHHVFHSCFHSHSSHSSASWHTLSPSTLVTPDVGPPWPCVLVDSARPDGDRGRNQTQSLDRSLVELYEKNSKPVRSRGLELYLA